MKHKLLGTALVVVLGLGGTAMTSPAAAQSDSPLDQDEILPMVFVHGGLGSGSQFESQALRFASNGYPAELIEMFEHDSLSYPDSQDEVFERLDNDIARIQDTHDVDQVYLLGHSQGTGLLLTYMNSDPERAANVAKYVNLDGSSGGSVPDGVDTLAIWGESFTAAEGDVVRELPGATNVTFEDQSHTQVVNSPESFVEMFTFLAGTEPFTEHVVAEPADEVEIGGRVPLFPENVGAAGETLEIWEIEPETGLRIGEEPDYSFELEGDASWGPVSVDGDSLYEFTVVREDSTHHIRTQQFVRSNYWLRLLTSEPGGLADSFWELGDDHSNMVITRNKEFWGDQGDASDSLEINGQNILNEATSSRENRTIGIFVHDDGVDGQTDLTEPVAPFGVMFLTGVNMHIPAASPPDGTVSIVSDPRLGQGPESVCVPNFASSEARVSVQFNAFHHVVDTDGNLVAGPENPECAPMAERPDDEGPSDGDGDNGEPTAPPAQPVTGTPSFTG